jgi:hypothetical protein
MLRVGFEPPTPVFERAKAVHALDRAATVIGKLHNVVDQMVKAEDETYVFIGFFTVILCKHSVTFILIRSHVRFILVLDG